MSCRSSRMVGNKQRGQKLIRKIVDIADTVNDTIKRDARRIDDNFLQALSDLSTTLETIKETLENYGKRKWYKRLAQVESISHVLDAQGEHLEASIQTFKMRSQVTTNSQIVRLMKLCAPKKPEPKGSAHIFRMRQINLLETHGVWPPEGPTLGQQWKGEWDGKAVVVRTLCSKSEESKKIGHPQWVYSVAEARCPAGKPLLGYSHPTSSTKFYVFECEVDPK
ncbi:uncharacterized protein C8Q71DRAFT_299644 [Rhodofomes roseus]|uniref:Mixed lineage kinase domain-containing protein n=1 Tax=Rhodofomes roseus TaxID=34475 RepID=A0ABQ8K382_9APHY|nr:uncharacterized protein C8Q71DRAFT_299644 [Rhodofomes roseus]KAH9831349.1 hypothetical protein C8Q71DRAFT_299644 [Rhodofomes roseus]